MAALHSSTTSRSNSTAASSAVNPRYACYWLPSCSGMHELDQCSYWQRDLRGKLGIYYSTDGSLKQYTHDRLSSVDLRHNPTGSTSISLLIYTIRPDNDLHILLTYSDRREKHAREVCRVLSLTSSKPRQRNEEGKQIAKRAFEWISDDEDIFERGFKQRLLFQHANVIYPVHVENADAEKLTGNFVPNERIHSLQWFRLADVLEKLPQEKIRLTRQATNYELAQFKHLNPTGIFLNNDELWCGTTVSLMCIRDHVPGGFDEFLK